MINHKQGRHKTILSHYLSQNIPGFLHYKNIKVSVTRKKVLSITNQFCNYSQSVESFTNMSVVYNGSFLHCHYLKEIICQMYASSQFCVSVVVDYTDTRISKFAIEYFRKNEKVRGTDFVCPSRVFQAKNRYKVPLKVLFGTALSPAVCCLGLHCVAS